MNNDVTMRGKLAWGGCDLTLSTAPVSEWLLLQYS